MKKKLIYLVFFVFLITISLFTNKDWKSDDLNISLDKLYTSAHADTEIDPVEECRKLCWNAPEYSCYLWITGTNIYIECPNAYPY